MDLLRLQSHLTTTHRRRVIIIILLLTIHTTVMEGGQKTIVVVLEFYQIFLQEIRHCLRLPRTNHQCLHQQEDYPVCHHHPLLIILLDILLLIFIRRHQHRQTTKTNRISAHRLPLLLKLIQSRLSRIIQ